MDTVTYEGEEIPLTILSSGKRRTIGITVKQTGEVVVRVPVHLSREKILSFVQSKADWIAKHRTRFLSREVCHRTYTDGETLPYYGRELTISRTAGDCLKANIIGDSWEVAYSPDYTIATWYGYEKINKDNEFKDVYEIKFNLHFRRQL